MGTTPTRKPLRRVHRKKESPKITGRPPRELTSEEACVLGVIKASPGLSYSGVLDGLIGIRRAALDRILRFLARRGRIEYKVGRLVDGRTGIGWFPRA